MCTVVTSNKWNRAKEDITVFKVLIHNDRDSCVRKKDVDKKYMTPYQYKRTDVPSVMRASTRSECHDMCAKYGDWPFYLYESSPERGYVSWKIYDGAIHSYACTTHGLRSMVTLHEGNGFEIVVRCHIPKGCLWLDGADGAVVSKTLVLDEVVADNTTLDRSLPNVRDWYREFCNSDFYFNVVCGPKNVKEEEPCAL